MSRASGRSFAAFFPQAPSVVQEKKRLARDRQKSVAKSPDLPGGELPSQSNALSGQRSHGEDSSAASHAQNGQLEQEDKHPTGGEAGDLLNGVGSASSHASTHSSVFSAAGTAARSKQTGNADSTPFTVDESSPPPQGNRTPNEYIPKLLNARINGSGLEYSPLSPHSAHVNTPVLQTSTSDPQKRPAPRPPPGSVMGQKAIYDPETDEDGSKISKELLKRGPRYRKFGEHEQRSPPDPRLAIPGYKTGNLNFKPSNENRIWKFRPRPAPYTIAPYSWDPAISVGPGPPTAVVITGFDPFTSDAQLRVLFSTYGDVAELDNKTDPATGVFLGVCSVRYRDSRGRGQSILATVAAKRAEKECNGQRLGTHTIRVERDRAGKKCKKYSDSVIRKHKEQREQEERLEASKRTAPPPSKTPKVDAAEAPPPNAPKGPSGRSAEVQKPMPRSVQMAILIEEKPVLEQIKRKPYVFISAKHVPVMGTTIPHLKKRLKFCRWEEIRCDETGYYIIFEDHKRGEDEAARCFQEYDKRELFTYQMIMECQQYGNPNYERSPSPERVLADKRKRLDMERQQKEDAMDWEEEKKQRALNLDPVLAAVEQLHIELRDKVMADIKTRIGAPTLYDFLDPSRHVDKRRKLGITDPSQQPRTSTFIPLDIDGTRLKLQNNKPLYGASIARIQREASRPTNNVFLDERRKVQKKPKAKVDVRSLHQRLQDLHSDEDSDDEHHKSITRDTDEHESRSVSRLSSIQPSERDGQVSLTPKKRRRIVRSETPMDEDSIDEDIGEARSTLDSALLRKDLEDMTQEELQEVVHRLPPNSKRYKGAKAELMEREKAKETDKLFRGLEAEPPDSSRKSLLGPDDVVQSTEIVIETKPKRKVATNKVKKKSKKQIFEEREAAKAAPAVAAEEEAAARAIDTDAKLPDISEAETPAQVVHPDDAEAADDADETQDEERAEVEWGVSTDHPRRTVEDDPNIILDIDGWQHVLKDNEDISLLREALDNQTSASFQDINAWAYQQKTIKALNQGSTEVAGYYVPNTTGSARTEGYKKILESEKSKYLPHRIRVAKAREEREKQADKPVIATEATRQAKMASTASSRTNRAINRTQIKDITTAKQNLSAEGQQTDAIRFNQLKKRKKLVKFDRSAIHGWGLYAEQDIAASDMIIEYVGEKVRQAVANIRELKYDRQGMGSSYLFRIDDDTVIDATKKGGIARFINHSCAPNCTAKIVKVDDEMRIAIYAKMDITRGDELTYDYKFEREMDSDMRVPCLCGSDVCKGFLN